MLFACSPAKKSSCSILKIFFRPQSTSLFQYWLPILHHKNKRMLTPKGINYFESFAACTAICNGVESSVFIYLHTSLLTFYVQTRMENNNKEVGILKIAIKKRPWQENVLQLKFPTPHAPQRACQPHRTSDTSEKKSYTVSARQMQGFPTLL